MNAPGHPPQFVPDALALVRELQALRRSSPSAPGYWDQMAAGLRFLCRAQSAWIVQRAEGVAGGGWRISGRAAEADQASFDAAWGRELEALAPRAADKGFAVNPGTTPDGLGVFRVAIRLEFATESLALLEIPQRERASLNELVLRARLVADLPGAVPAQPAAEPAALPVPMPAAGGGSAPPRLPVVAGAPFAAEPPSSSLAPAAQLALSDLLDLAAQAMREPRLGAATLTLVNGLAALAGAAQVAFGWSDHGYVHAATISHLDQFNAGSELVEMVESALDESLEHDAPLRNPAPVGAPVHPALDRLRDALGFTGVCSLSLRRGLEPAPAALLVAHADGRTLDDASLAHVRTMFDLALPWLIGLREREKWWGARLRDWAALRLSALLGPQHVWLKTAGVAFGLFALYATFATWDYRVNGNGQLTTDSTRLVSASFDGRVDTALVSSGDMVHRGDVLGVLDTRELRQQETDARAEIRRYAAEADKARATAAWAEVEIASARQEQAQARLARVLDMIDQASARAPFDGVVVEGERKDLLGAPVRKGDKLFKLARIEGLYVVTTVPERDIPLIAPNATGELALVSRPDVKIPLRVSAVIPVAQTKGQEGNQFMIRAELLQAPESWWRPGMSGAVRIDAGRRNVAWILTHRLIDRLRMLLWW
ncbi:hypothetical protein GCM10023144_23060 [Pigmentiphaga soli]|uniref:HlyD family efflux transporter periplasmic adaptor subunit n=1 Tax=Pigmentiphaga soli TaxID=1007095 RepID=A0ABP8H0M7_9BURK